ncbi:MAG TPA: hypothetical protein H9717_12625 [Candidatus Eisenbergiella merdipullorum]|uniref:DUF4832 domain-containing protein n=1 Tax=Candidatus Eisenbergiella merdipullorum TaxID=2838553 RepID=A0A9D2I9C0_9FIRM|nr:hypothetical protein [Candidatus Eisenbergiella merdipullorum]
MENRFRGRRSEQVAYFSAYKGHIHNPGMGIISMAVSDHMVMGYCAADREKADREKPFTLTRKMLQEVNRLPFIDNIYIRVGWNDVQKRAGKLDLCPAFETAVEEAERSGKSWGFRIMQCSPSNPSGHLMPEFLEGRIPMVPMPDDGSYGPRPKLRPVYTEEYLKYWDEMLHLLGERFDADRSLEYADISGFGFWGEGHHSGDADAGDPAGLNAVLERLIASHQSAFPRTPMVMNLHLSECWEAGQKALEQGGWTRRDCYYKWFQAHQAQDGLNRRGDAAMIFETIMPGLTMEDDEDPSFRHSSLGTADRLCDYGANYATVGFNPQDTLYAAHMLPMLFQPLNERLGYRLRPSIVWKIENGDGNWSLVLGMVNDGCANPPGELTFLAESNGRSAQVTENGGGFGGRMRLVELPLPEGHDDDIAVRLQMRMGQKQYAVRFAADTGEREAPFELHIHLNHKEWNG